MKRKPKVKTSKGSIERSDLEPLRVLVIRERKSLPKLNPPSLRTFTIPQPNLPHRRRRVKSKNSLPNACRNDSDTVTFAAPANELGTNIG